MNMFKLLLLTFTIHGGFCTGAYAQSTGRQLELNSAWGVDAKSNLIKNPSAAKNAQFATTSNASVARGTANKIDNKASWTVDASAQNGYAEFTLISGDADSISGNCEFKGIFLGDGSLYKAQILDGSSNVLAQTVTLTNESNWRAFSVNYPCAAVASRKVRITQTEAGTAPAVSFGKLYYGAATNIGSAVPPNTFTAFVSSAGAVSRETGADWINGSCTQSAGNFDCTFATGLFTSIPNCFADLFDSSSGDQTMNRVAAGTSTVSILTRTGAGTGTSIGFQLSCTKTGADFVQPAITPNDWSYNWTSYTPTITAASGSLTNFTLSQTEHRRDESGKLWIRGRLNFTGLVGTWTAPRISLPSGLVIAVTRYNLPSVLLGDAGSNSYSASVEAQSTLSYVTITGLTGTNGAGIAISQASPFSWASSDDIFWNVGPIDIVGWNNSQSASQFLGSATVSDLTKAYRINTWFSESSDCTGSPCAFKSKTPGISSVTRSATGTYTVNFVANEYSTSPNCVVTNSRNFSGHACALDGNVATATTQGVACMTTNSSGTAVDSRFSIICVGTSN